MDTGNVSAVISATAGISGVLLGNAFVAIKELLISHSKRRKDTAYLAIIVVSHLDRFANGCLHVAYDDGTAYGQPAGRDGEESVPTAKLPEFQPLDIDVEWKALPRDLMYSIMRLPDESEQIQNRLAGIEEFDDDYPDHTEFFWVRRREFAALGLTASELARRLRRHAGMQVEEPKPGEWHRDQGMREVIQTIDEKRAAYERRRNEKSSSTPFGPTP
ncbi:hypothetical protein [Paraburkholderia humisilvae]|uniref:Uncharacterized protein n=1 Tax=Paraburkholderia humisilvae TaxID=627669 RepID=A0A6J5DWM9_9BURK|nr:hypothetical protein [Paraburkholderia humisilvae]CAB3758700.1 hypothetical protein LMG29542_03408 [Paraburkholderia humisilvae]